MTASSSTRAGIDVSRHHHGSAMTSSYSRNFFTRTTIVRPYDPPEVQPFSDDLATISPRTRLLYAFTAYADPDSGLVKILSVEYLAAITSLSQSVFNVYAEQLVSETPALVTRARYHPSPGKGPQPHFRYRVSPELLTATSRSRSASFVNGRLDEVERYRRVTEAVSEFEKRASTYLVSLIDAIVAAAPTLSRDGYTIDAQSVSLNAETETVQIYFDARENEFREEAVPVRVDIFSDRDVHLEVRRVPKVVKTILRAMLDPLVATFPSFDFLQYPSILRQCEEFERSTGLQVPLTIEYREDFPDDDIDTGEADDEQRGMLGGWPS
jgi:hypothetical protein